MFCESCGIEIPPAWVVVIAKNECPACGGVIMSDSTKELLEELKGAMEQMPNDPEGLAGWLLSNYRLQKIGKAEPTAFHRGRPQPGHQHHNLKIADNPKSIFFQRAGVPKELTRKESLAQIANQINNAANGDENLSIDLNEIDDYQGMDEYDAQILAQSRLSQANSAKNILARNVLTIEGDGKPLNMQETAAIAQALGGKTQAIDNELPPALQADRYKRLQAQHEVASGGKVGVIRRG